MTGKDLYYDKYLKYKNKYLNLKDQIGGVITDIEKFEYEQLEEVTFPNIQAGNEDEILVILECLRINPHLKRLTFRNISQILDNPLFEAFLRKPLINIFLMKNIEYLNISGNNLFDRHIIILSEILKNGKDFKVIDLTNNNITIKGYPELISALPYNTDTDKYVEVNLKGNPIINTTGLGWREILRRQQELMTSVNSLGIIVRFF